MAEPVEQPAPPIAELFSGDYRYPLDEFLAVIEANAVPHKCYYAHTPHKTAYVANALTGRARLWYVRWAAMREHKAPVYSEHGASFNSAWKTYKDKHFETFRRDLVAEFGIPETLTTEFEFRHLTQNRTTVQQYAERWTRLGDNCGEKLDTEYNRLWFIHGLNPQIRDHMLLVFPFHRTFARVVEEATASEEFNALPMNIDSLALSQAVGLIVSQSITDAVSKAVSQAVSQAVVLATPPAEQGIEASQSSEAEPKRDASLEPATPGSEEE